MWLVDSPTVLILFLAIASVLLGVWTQWVRLAGKDRYDLFYLHFTLASFACLTLLCFILGMVRPNEITILDSFSGISLRKMAWAVLSGISIGIGSSLIASTVPVAGTANALGMGGGVAFALTLVWTASAGRLAMGWSVWVAAIAAVVATAVAAVAYKRWFAAQPKPAVAASVKAALSSGHHRSKVVSLPPETAVKGILTAVIGGLVLGCALPLHEESRESLIGLPVYTAVFLMSVGALVSLVVMAPYYFFFPQTGMPGRIKDYWKTPPALRTRGWVAGVIWSLGTLALFLGLGSRSEVYVAPAGLQFFLLFAWPGVGALAGLILWGDNKDGASRPLAFGSVGIFAVAVALAAWVR